MTTGKTIALTRQTFVGKVMSLLNCFSFDILGCFSSNIYSLKNRDIILPTKVCLVKARVFPVVMYGCESWTIKKAEHQRIDAFVLWYWRRLLRIPWTLRRYNQFILKEISPEYSLERLMAEAETPILWSPDAKN